MFDTWEYIAADFLGIADLWSNAIGETGYILGSAGGPNAIGRLPDLTRLKSTPYAPDIMLIEMGLDDDTYTGAQEQTAATAYLAAVRAEFPVLPIFVLGCVGKTLNAAAATLAIENAIADAVTATNDPLIFFIPICTDTNGSWFTGTGYIGHTTGAGNTDVYVGSDDQHMSSAGHYYFGQRVAKAVLKILNTLNV